LGKEKAGRKKAYVLAPPPISKAVPITGKQQQHPGGGAG